MRRNSRWLSRIRTKISTSPPTSLLANPHRKFLKEQHDDVIPYSPSADTTPHQWISPLQNNSKNKTREKEEEFWHQYLLAQSMKDILAIIPHRVVMVEILEFITKYREAILLKKQPNLDHGKQRHDGGIQNSENNAAPTTVVALPSLQTISILFSGTKTKNQNQNNKKRRTKSEEEEEERVTSVDQKLQSSPLMSRGGGYDVMPHATFRPSLLLTPVPLQTTESEEEQHGASSKKDKKEEISATPIISLLDQKFLKDFQKLQRQEEVDGLCDWKNVTNAEKDDKFLRDFERLKKEESMWFQEKEIEKGCGDSEITRDFHFSSETEQEKSETIAEDSNSLFSLERQMSDAIQEWKRQQWQYTHQEVHHQKKSKLIIDQFLKEYEELLQMEKKEKSNDLNNSDAKKEEEEEALEASLSLLISKKRGNKGSEQQEKNKEAHRLSEADWLKECVVYYVAQWAKDAQRPHTQEEASEKESVFLPLKEENQNEAASDDHLLRATQLDQEISQQKMCPQSTSMGSMTEEKTQQKETEKIKPPQDWAGGVNPWLLDQQASTASTPSSSLREGQHNKQNNKERTHPPSPAKRPSNLEME